MPFPWTKGKKDVPKPKNAKEDEPDSKKDLDEFFITCDRYMPKTDNGQVMLGAISGWLTGYLAVKEYSSTATCILAGVLALEIGHYSGYTEVRFDWIHKALSMESKRYIRRLKSSSPFENFNNMREFLSRNRMINASFAVGYVVGVAIVRRYQ